MDSISFLNIVRFSLLLLIFIRGENKKNNLSRSTPILSVLHSILEEINWFLELNNPNVCSIIYQMRARINLTSPHLPNSYRYAKFLLFTVRLLLNFHLSSENSSRRVCTSLMDWKIAVGMFAQGKRVKCLGKKISARAGLVGILVAARYFRFVQEEKVEREKYILPTVVRSMLSRRSAMATIIKTIFRLSLQPENQVAQGHSEITSPTAVISVLVW